MDFVARIPEDKIAEIKQSVDIVDVISEYVQLRKQGRNYFGLCPFHGENTPSFSVSQDKQIFHCFGCGMGGNAFSFIMEIEGVSFQEAAEKVATKGNVELEIDSSIHNHIESSLPPDHIEMIKAHELLAKFYHHLLMNTNEGADALNHLFKRGFTKESIQKFNIGYSLPEWNFAVNYLDKHGFSLETMEKAGLLARRNKDQAFVDRFRNRIMFPLLNEKGKTIAFSARALSDEDHPKYLNTPETQLFHKSSILYNYHQARSHIRRIGYTVLFEGFADVISADGAGVSNGVALMGTALTEKHIQILKRLSNSIVLCLDSDDAGLEAAFKSGSLLERYGMDVTVAQLPDKLDPDDYIQQFGAEKFREDVIGNAQTWMAFKLFYFRRGKNLQNEGDLLDFIDKAIIEIAKLGNAVERDMYLRQLSEEFSLSLDALMSQLNELIQPHVDKKHEKQQAGERQPEPRKVNLPQRQRLPAIALAERQLIAKMMQQEELVYRIMEMMGDGTFHYDEHQAIVTYLLGYYEEGNKPDSSLFMNYLPDLKLKKIVSEIEMLAVDLEYSEKELNDYVSHVLKYPKLLMIKEKQAEQKAAERKKEFSKAIELAKEIVELRRSL
ncbi:DNA primase [Virgibacillus soli]|uniref:DNA primase n=1 Tax=Lederbergia galactosidilytica TaxID=217031 RepID=A0A178A3C5_9BACI|nr:DNA primase [Lederbergia galactosidilytica]KRG15561.1 DNA primase [Virgibacillus soli]OAK74705.1 DNA primase [Lederbergia galactosidilytica]